MGVREMLLASGETCKHGAGGADKGTKPIISNLRTRCSAETLARYTQLDIRFLLARVDLNGRKLQPLCVYEEWGVIDEY